MYNKALGTVFSHPGQYLYTTSALQVTPAIEQVAYLGKATHEGILEVDNPCKQ